MNVNDLTIGQAKELAAMFQQGKENVPCPYEIGANYLIRTVTMIYTGKLVQVTDLELVLIDAAWIPETDRWADTVATGALKECEPYPDGELVIIGRGALLDAVRWKASGLPRGQK